MFEPEEETQPAGAEARGAGRRSLKKPVSKRNRKTGGKRNEYRFSRQ